MPGQCFVVMGFGEKTDYRTQRLLDLDKTYRVIRAAVEACELECIRADDIVHAGVIDRPMYQMLLNAELVIADLSTSNENAIYELGVRHALRPNTTIVIAEDQFKFPFDLKSVLIRTYPHLGKGIDFEDAKALQESLTAMIKKMQAAQQDIDSPVFTFLPDLQPPVIGARTPAPAVVQAAPTAGAAAIDTTFSRLLDNFRAARTREDWSTARTLLATLRTLKPDDPYLVQQHAFALYQGKDRDLAAARAALSELRPHESNDPETLGIWGAIHKRLWDDRRDRADLDEAILSYERGFYLRRDYYTGINYAFLLNERAREQTDPAEATADRVFANRVRVQVLSIVDIALKALPRRADGAVADPNEAYWLGATRLEALLGLGRTDELATAEAGLFESAPETWMPGTTRRQLDKLRALL